MALPGRASEGDGKKSVGKALFAVYGSYTMGRYSSSDFIEMLPSRIGFIYDCTTLAAAGKAARIFGMDRFGGCRFMG
ncbi:hypothetical protein LB566_07675 [Mesorhizobium sp. CA13]|uniref:hypothetical protein n=1 Tax=Mesorhizobium sp. CA13 TaxID=2876643 RepID=UPI001CCEF61E|nr:hypothetical protein [Mesorhizobium sp. CA13]MBZ9853673.1 hypothetical protein [Mesorhizobium sp. CA13]